MFDIGWTELLLIGIVALIVIGPQDLPDMFRQLGRFTSKLRAMSRDFQRAMEQAAKESGVKDLARDVNNLASPKNLGLSAVKDAADRFEKWDPLKPATSAQKPLTPPPMPATPSPAAAAAATAAAAPAASQAVAPVPPPGAGPETRALYDKKAKAAEARKAAAAAKASPEAPAPTPPAPTPPAPTPP
ncbi:MAG: Sec-independent protein translocase protein TatB, partial [Paracoccaceae bacterium]